ncbi:E3 ubiquitin-protein ligase RNF181 isoform X2 [Peromyscus eremicus]|uniref:E3 ubiquitin-protein ligase RNF181 isoform X2 n=1 Tax=Peromyscus eremicus TaxID=42410 RepID=UPI0027DDA1EB|nr:E3 ubiquitin-protein ligase RNF181 isoform X2 [Peromyscus eremicus]
MSGARQGIVGRTELEKVGVAEGGSGEDCRGGGHGHVLISLFNRMDFEDLGLVDWEHHLPPPAAKAVVESLPRTVIGSSNAELKCPVCLLEFEEEETVIEMPCHHLFHSDCILPWLSKTNSCPLCRHELPTDDDSYEEHKKDKARRQQQQHRLENLHGAMYT